MLPYLHHSNGTRRFWQFRHGIGMSEGFSLALRGRQQLLQFFKRQEHHAACQPDRASALQTAAETAAAVLCWNTQHSGSMPARQSLSLAEQSREHLEYRKSDDIMPECQS